MSEADQEIAQTLSAIATGGPQALQKALEGDPIPGVLDPKTHALVRLATSIALDAPPATYAWQVDDALAAGAAPPELVALLQAVSPQVGVTRAVAAAPEIMLALGLKLPGASVDAGDEAS